MLSQAKRQVSQYVIWSSVLPHKINCSTNSPYEFHLPLISLCFRFPAVKGYTLGNVIIRTTHEIHDLGEVGEPPSLRVSGTNGLMRKVFGITDPALVHRSHLLQSSFCPIFSQWPTMQQPERGLPRKRQYAFKKHQEILSKENACSFLTNSRGKGRESSSRRVSRTGSTGRQTLRRQSPLLLRPNIYISSTAPPHSEDGIHLA